MNHLLINWLINYSIALRRVDSPGNTRKRIYSIILFCSRKSACKMICCIQFPISPFHFRLKWYLFRTNQICEFSHSFDILISNYTGKSTRKTFFCMTFHYRKRLLDALPALHQLDGVEITRQDRLEAGCTV